MKNAADAARHLRRAIDRPMTKAGKSFSQIPRLDSIVLSENASFLWFRAAAGEYLILSASGLLFARA
jgi:hypothetical protein